MLHRLRSTVSSDIVVVDDGSTDGSLPAVRASGVYLPHLIRHKHNRGCGVALRSGFEFALEHGYEVVITCDADGQHNPMDVPRLMESLPNGDIVSGSRFHPDSPRIGTPPPERLRGNERLTKLVREHTGYEITDSACGLRAYHAAALRELDITETGYTWPYQIWGQAAQAGLTVCEVPVMMIYEQEEDARKIDPERLEVIVQRCEKVLLRSLAGNPLRDRLRRWFFTFRRRSWERD